MSVPPQPYSMSSGWAPIARIFTDDPPVSQNVQTPFAAVEQEIHDGQVRHERPKALGVRRALKGLEGDPNPRFLEASQVEITPRPRAGEVRVGSQGPTDGDQALRPPLPGRKRGSQEELRPDAQGLRQVTEGRQVQVGEPRPFPGVDLLEERPMDLKERRPAVTREQGLKVLPRPGGSMVDADLGDALGETVEDGNGQPLPAGGRLDPIPILPLVLLELDVVEDNEAVDLGHLVEIAQPG